MVSPGCCLLLLLVVSLTGTAIDGALDLTIPKNFTRSRFSLRHRSSTTPDPEVTPPPTDERDSVSTVGGTTTTTTTVDQFLDTDLETDGSQSAAAVDCGIRIGDNHPWIAVLEHTDPTGRSGRKTLSKGVLIDERHVLTTVSSVHNSHPFWTVSKVRLGDSPTWGPAHVGNRSDIVRADIEAIFNHRHRDVAIVRLAAPVARLIGTIEPICLPPSNSYSYRELEMHRCVRSTAAAGGRQTPPPPVVSAVSVQLVQAQDCSIMFRRKEAQFTHDEFCAWDEPGDTCTGDLGGPLVAHWNGRHYVVGLSSYINVRDDDYVPSDYPGVFARVGSHMEWIRAVLQQPLAESA